MREREELHDFSRQKINLDEVIYLKKICGLNKDLKYDDIDNIKTNAELLLNYIHKINKLQFFLKYFNRNVNKILNELPSDIIIKGKGEDVSLSYIIRKKECDKDYSWYCGDKYDK